MASTHGTGEHAEVLRLDEAAAVQQMSPDVARETIAWRIALNMQETGHPFHHKTANGTIVEADATLEALVGRLTDAAPAVPVIHNWYTTDAGRAFLRAAYGVH